MVMMLLLLELVVIGEITAADGRRDGRTLATTAAAAAAAAQQVGRVLAEQRIHVVGRRRGRQTTTTERGQIGRYGRRRRRRHRYGRGGRRHRGAGHRNGSTLGGDCRRRRRRRQKAAQCGDVLHGQTERCDLCQFLVVRVHGQMRNGPPERLEGLVDFSHATPFARVRSLPPVPMYTTDAHARVLL